MRSHNNDAASQGDTVVGLFEDQPSAELAIQKLKREGFTDDAIGVIMQDRHKQQELADSTGSSVSDAAATGAVGGGIAGGVLGLLAGVGALAIPGIGPIIAGGALASTLAGAGIGAAAGGLLGALAGMGVPEEDARFFEEGVRAGGILMTIKAGSRAGEARQILREHGAELESADRMAGSATASGVSEGEGEPRTIEVPFTREEVVIDRDPGFGRLEASGDLGQDEDELRVGETGSTSWRGSERRYQHDGSYNGPERRLANV